MGDIKELGRIGLKTLIYFEILSTIAIILGMIVANIFHPGTLIDIKTLHGSDISQYVATAKSATSNPGIWATLLGIIHTNIFKALANGDMMPVILFSVFFGLGISAIGNVGKLSSIS